MLPDDNVGEALNSLAKLDAERGLLKRDIAAVDLRLLDRVTVRLRDDAVGDHAGRGRRRPKMPTASTKVTPVKGKT